MGIVLVTDYPWPDLEIERETLAAAGHRLVEGPPSPSPAEQIEKLAARHAPDAILSAYSIISPQAIAAAPKLRIIAKTGIGIDNIALDAATQRGVWVTNVPDYCIEEVSDHAIAMLLALTRGIVEFDRDVKAGGWNTARAKLRRTASLTIGIIGYGRIGRATARKCAAFGSTVLAYDVAAPVESAGVRIVGLDELLAASDAVIVHAPLVASTRHLVGDDFVAKLKRGALVINVSRGPLVDNDALLRGLQSGAVGGAGLDVVEGEPDPPRALVDRSDVIVTPHIAFASDVAVRELRRRASEEVVRVLAGERPVNPCNDVGATARA